MSHEITNTELINSDSTLTRRGDSPIGRTNNEAGLMQGVPIPPLEDLFLNAGDMLNSLAERVVEFAYHPLMPVVAYFSVLGLTFYLRPKTEIGLGNAILLHGILPFVVFGGLLALQNNPEVIQDAFNLVHGLLH